MKNKRILSLLLCLQLLASAFLLPVFAADVEDPAETAEQTDVPDGEAAETAETAESGETTQTGDAALTLNCEAALLVELNSGTTVYEYNADQRLYPASLTKMMTCMLALEGGNLSDEITVNGSLFADMDSDASSANLVDGEVMTLEDLLYCVMVPSANDASIVVADHIGGSVEAFVDMMNAKAAELGCRDTHFANPDGLHEDDHYTTARDLAIIAQAALQNDTFRTLCGTAVHEIPANNISDARVVYTTNYFLDTTITPKYYWEKVSGVKTGYTSQAGRCLVSLVEDGDRSFLGVVLGCPTDYDENGEVIYEHFVQSRKLLEYGLDNFGFVSVLSHLSPIAQVPVSSGKTSSVVITPQEDVKALLPLDYDKNKLQIDYKLDAGDTLEAPVEANQAVGTVTVRYNGAVVGTTQVETISAVERSGLLTTAQESSRTLVSYLPIVLIVVAVLVLLVTLVGHQRARKKRARRRRR